VPKSVRQLLQSIASTRERAGGIRPPDRLRVSPAGQRIVSKASS
jgi:hypothetical protein